MGQPARASPQALSASRASSREMADHHQPAAELWFRRLRCRIVLVLPDEGDFVARSVCASTLSDP